MYTIGLLRSRPFVYLHRQSTSRKFHKRSAVEFLDSVRRFSSSCSSVLFIAAWRRTTFSLERYPSRFTQTFTGSARQVDYRFAVAADSLSHRALTARSNQTCPTITWKIVYTADDEHGNIGIGGRVWTVFPCLARRRGLSTGFFHGKWKVSFTAKPAGNEDENVQDNYPQIKTIVHSGQ